MKIVQYLSFKCNFQILISNIIHVNLKIGNEFIWVLNKNVDLTDPYKNNNRIQLKAFENIAPCISHLIETLEERFNSQQKFRNLQDM